MPKSLKPTHKNIQRLKHHFAFICLFALSLFAHNSFAQGVKASATLDSTLIFIGGQIDLKLEVSQPIDATISWPAFAADTITSNIEIVERGQVDTTKANDRIVLSQLFRITSFDSGLHYIPPIELELIGAESKEIAKSNSLSLMVVNPFPVVNPEDGITGIKDPINTPFMLSEIEDILTYTGIGILLIGLLIFLYSKYGHLISKKEKPAEKVVPLEPAHIIAMRELDRIQESKLWEKNREKEYYTDITDTLRTYLEHRFNVTAMEQTSDEILDTLKSVGEIDKGSMAEIDQVLKLADLVKFAKFNPLPEENNRSIKNAYAFVDKTKRAVVETSEKEETETDETIPVKTEE